MKYNRREFMRATRNAGLVTLVGSGLLQNVAFADPNTVHNGGINQDRHGVKQVRHAVAMNLPGGQAFGVSDRVWV